MESRTKLASKLAEEVGAYVAEQFRADIGSDKKEDGTDVTDADKEAEHRIRAAIRVYFPDDAIVGEEHENEEGESGITWYIDPIDGTTNFVNGIPIFAVSIAYADDTGLLGAAISMPMMKTLYLAERGKGASMNGRPISVSTLWDAERPVITFSVADRDDERIAALFAHRPRPRARIFGSAVATLAFFAEGGASGTFLIDMHPWDYAAGLLIAQEAGAFMEPLDMKAPHPPRKASFILAAEENIDAFRTFIDQLTN